MKYPNLKAEMARRGYSYEDLGKLLGIGGSAISHKMTGRNGFDLEEAKILCKHFKMSFEELFYENQSRD